MLYLPLINSFERRLHLNIKIQCSPAARDGESDLVIITAIVSLHLPNHRQDDDKYQNTRHVVKSTKAFL